jgi:predicted ATP-grasp superfamily ATP-dependent carboligase
LGESQNKVLITDPIDGCRSALLVVRSLGRRNIDTTLMAQENLVPARFSRWHSQSVCTPSSFDNLEGFVKSLLKNAKTGKYLTIFPLSDSSLLPVSEHREQLSPYLKLVLPSHESVLNTLDKSKTLRIANEEGIPTPETFQAKNIAEVIKISAKIRYPAVIKPKQSYIWNRNGKANFSRPFYVNSASELFSTYEKVDKNFPEPIIQEYVPGHNVSVALLFDHGEPKAGCAIKVKRTMPVTGGNSVLRESISLDPALLRFSSDLLRRLQWHGVAEVEFKIDSRDSTPKLMEINGRFWGSMNVAIESGVDFPYLLYLLAKGEKICPVFKYKVGVKFRWLNGDIENLQSTLRGEPKVVNYEFSSKLKTILRFLKFYGRNMHYDGFSLHDPLPFFLDESLFAVKTIKGIVGGEMHSNGNPIKSRCDLAPQKIDFHSPTRFSSKLDTKSMGHTQENTRFAYNNCIHYLLVCIKPKINITDHHEKKCR